MAGVYQTVMGIVRSVVTGAMAWTLLSIWHVRPEYALGGAVVIAFLSESNANRRGQRRLLNHSNALRTQLDGALRRITNLQGELNTTSKNLNEAMQEINRRDTIGTPATRELMARQEEAMALQAAVIENRGNRSDEAISSLERLLIMQAEQTAKMQESLTTLLTTLASEPRQNVTMQDSVLVQDNPRPTSIADLWARPGARTANPNYGMVADLFE